MQNNSTPKIASTKKKLIRIILISILVLFVSEGFLRILNYGGELDIFERKQTGDVEEYVLNENFATRYFFEKEIKPPFPLSQTFSIKKDSSTYRIFCLGASSTQGYPYTPNASFPAAVQNILSTLNPNKNIEVINCGTTALSSLSVLDMTSEIVDNYDPDLLVVYSGHNEFYGTLNYDSRFGLFKSRVSQRILLKLQKFKVLYLARNIIEFLFDENIQFDSEVDLVSKEREIKFGSELFNNVESDFKENVKEIIDEAQSSNTKIIFSSLTSNLKDFAPVTSKHSEALDENDLNLINSFISNAVYQNENNHFSEASELFKKALQIDSSFAQSHYDLAKCYFDLGKYEEAKTHFIKAKDFDVIRLRAPSSFNDIIKSITDEKNIPYADVELSFKKNSANGITSDYLLHEYIHPNQNGYLLIAKSIVNVMSFQNMISRNWNWEYNLSDSQYLAMNKSTILDEEVANYKIFKNTSKFLFSSYKNGETYTRVGNIQTEELARAYVDSSQINLIELHLSYGAKLQNQKQYKNELAEYEAALAIQPLLNTYNKIGSFYLVKTKIAFKIAKDYKVAYENYVLSEEYFKEGLKYWPNNTSLNYNLGLLYFMRNNRLDEAETQFIKVLELDPQYKNSYLKLSELYTRKSDFDEAKRILLLGIENLPNQARLYTDVGILLFKDDSLAEAKSYLEKALDIKSDLKAKYFLQKVNVKLKNI